MQYSAFGLKLGAQSGIMDLMDDMGKALAAPGAMRMLGGGNPAQIPAVNAVWQARLREIAEKPDLAARMVANYDGPQGRRPFLQAMADYLKQHYGWPVGPENIAVTNGSQTATFLILNLFGGRTPDGEDRTVLFPVLPEYIGYADQGLPGTTFRATPPRIEYIDEHTHKYHVDLNALEVGPEVGLIAVSRPTNPSGNVLTDDEVAQLDRIARANNVPLFIDNAYGAPFPNILFEPTKLIWNGNIILGMSLSKIGLPGVRTGIVVASEEIIEKLSAMNSVLSLANGNTGQDIVEPLLSSGDIDEIVAKHIFPFYQERSRRAHDWLAESFDPSVPWSVHKLEGSIFLWLWLKDLPMTSRQLYQRLKDEQVLVVPGEYFFFGGGESFARDHHCLRINYAQEEPVVKEGLRIIARMANSLYQ